MKKSLVFLASLAALSTSTLAYAENLALTLLPNPPVMGKQTVEIKVMDDKGKPSKNATLEGEAVMPPMGTMGLMKSKIKIEKAGEGAFAGKFNLSMDGTWYLSLKVTTGKTTKDYFYKLVTGSKDVTPVPEIPKEGAMEHMHH